jgi:leader peptidase (prepilin peptidase)/N-methyltransferase
MDLTVAFISLVFLLGASVGSFLNVVVYRVPHALSVVKPRSYCPGCKTSIPSWQNIPVLSWLFLRGRCASCGMKISARYVLVEVAMGVLTLALFLDFVGGNFSPEHLVELDLVNQVLGPFIVYTGFVAALVAISFIDLDHFIIPDSITFPGAVLGVVATYLVGQNIGLNPLDGLIGLLSGAGFIIAIILGYGLLTGREGMGGGDWKLMGFIGAFLGWQCLGFVLLAGSVQGLLFALIFRRSFAVDELPPDPLEVAEHGGVIPAPPPSVGNESESQETAFSQLAVPFGPFLSMGAIEFLLFREDIMAWMATLVNPL